LFFVSLLFLGLGGANFAMLYAMAAGAITNGMPGECVCVRDFGGRFLGGGFTFLVGAGVAHFHTIGIPVALTSLAFLFGMPTLTLGHETKGQTLPA
jgi:hypothetical protein